MSPQGSRGAADLLRFPGGALDPLADDQPDRIDLCDDPATPSSDQRQRHTQGEVNDDVQARPGCAEEMAATTWLGAADAGAGRKDFCGWSATGRRLVQTSWNTTFDNTSPAAAAPPRHRPRSRSCGPPDVRCAPPGACRRQRV